MNLLFKGIIVYVAVIIAMRFMGKRQIGELQPGELVITFLLSEVAAMPLQGDNIPILASVSLVFLLVVLEMTSSYLSMKSRVYRTMTQGHSVLIIKEGRLLKRNMKMIRYSNDDLMEALRLKDVFDINTVQYAYIETNGSVSIQLKKKYQGITAEDMNKKIDEEFLPCLVISDGRVITREFSLCGMTEEKLEKLLKKENLTPKEVFLMTADKKGNTYIVRKGEQ
ncbi:MAG: DUF421 domain-containing protein [Clostridia bacterium]|nr:DUF421 domain-containing protein [Clostridia bacterium]